jgi:hypothetical protein
MRVEHITGRVDWRVLGGLLAKQLKHNEKPWSWRGERHIVVSLEELVGTHTHTNPLDKY